MWLPGKTVYVFTTLSTSHGKLVILIYYGIIKEMVTKHIKVILFSGFANDLVNYINMTLITVLILFGVAFGIIG